MQVKQELALLFFDEIRLSQALYEMNLDENCITKAN